MRAKERLQEQVERYFAACDATRQQVPQKNGTVLAHQVPYTLYGLCAAIGLCPERVLAIVAGEGTGWQSKLLAQALCRVAAYTMERALLGELTHQVALAALRELGFMPETAEAAQTVAVTMDGIAEVLGQ
ncbi:MAG: hypothetical protein FWE69_02990 [Clostridiales bacterium]|nr:hypothetical protein [Clostridiales bacterium]